MTNKCYQSGVCCTLFLINLTEEEYKSKAFETQLEEFGVVENFGDAKKWGANLLKQKEDGSCTYFIGNTCSIHERRPRACREFFCTSKAKKYGDMVKQVNDRKRLLNIKIH